MLLAVHERLKQTGMDFEIVLETGANSPYKSRCRLLAYQKASLFNSWIDSNRLSYFLPVRLRQMLRDKFGLITEADIDVVLDASGFAYGDQWTSRNIQRLAACIGRMRRRGRRYIFLPQAFGPFTRQSDRALLARALPDAALICPREEASRAHLADLGISMTNVQLFPDFTNALEPPDAPQSDFGNAGLIIPNANMVGKRNSSAAWAESYVPLMARTAEAMVKAGLEPVLMNHEGSGDVDLCHLISSRYGQRMRIVTKEDPLEVKRIIASSRLVVSSRFHGCVSALSQSVPCLGTSWSHKYEELFREYGVPGNLMTPEMSGASILEKMQAAMDQVEGDDYQDRVAALKARTREMWTRVIASLPPAATQPVPQTAVRARG
jgi:colanic acid/amylovoran biosynthesis protein